MATNNVDPELRRACETTRRRVAAETGVHFDIVYTDTAEYRGQARGLSPGKIWVSTRQSPAEAAKTVAHEGYHLLQFKAGALTGIRGRDSASVMDRAEASAIGYGELCHERWGSEWLGKSRPEAPETKTVTLTSLKLEGAGQFSGYAATFGEEDLQGDIIERGAFRASIAKSAGVFLLLNQHDPDKEIGLVNVDEDDRGLKIKRGQFYVDPSGDVSRDVAGARSAYNKMRYRHQAGKPMQMSIGYKTVKARRQGGARLLQEVELYEVSVVTFAANPRAVTTTVKDSAFEQTLAELKASTANGQGDDEVMCRS